MEQIVYILSLDDICRDPVLACLKRQNYPHALREIHFVIMEKLKHVGIDYEDAQLFLLSLKAPLLEILVKA